MSETGRNEPCPCGSGKKYKRCCMGAGVQEAKRTRLITTIVIAILAVAGGVTLAFSQEAGILVAILGAAGAGVWLWLTAPPPSTGGGDPGAINFGR